MIRSPLLAIVSLSLAGCLDIADKIGEDETLCGGQEGSPDGSAPCGDTGGEGETEADPDAPDPRTLNVPADYATIQAAIDAARGGDTIEVEAGTYVERIDFLGKDVRVVGVDGPEATVIDGGGVGPVVTLQSGESADATLEGFTVTGGVADEGGGIYVYGASATLSDLIVEGNSAGAGGGLYVAGSSMGLQNVWVEDNFAALDAGGLRSDGSALLSLTNVALLGNHADGCGGGAWLVDAEKLRLLNGAIVGNSAGTCAGGIGVNGDAALASFANTLIAGNTPGLLIA